MNEQADGRMLIVGDEALIDMYAAWLADEYAVETTAPGGDALEAPNSDVAVILPDRRMPGLPGEDVLQSVRDQGFDCRAAMGTGVRPNTDVVDLGFDDYLVKPVDDEDLRTLVARIFERQTHDNRLQQYYSLASKRVALKTEADRTDGPEHLDEVIRTVDEQLKSVQLEMT